MSKWKSLLAGGLVLAMICSMPAFAANPVGYTAIADKALNEVTSLYENIYNISSAEASIVKTENDEAGNIIITVATSFDRTLKVQSVEEMPYIQGLEATLANLTDPMEIAVATEYMEFKKADLQQYIGVPQDTNIELQIKVPAMMPISRSTTELTLSDITYVGMEENVPASELAPVSGTEAKQLGEDEALEVIRATQGPQLMSNRANSVIKQYNRVTARDYARKWSCNTGAVNDHASCHNPTYKFYNSNDCTNFVSQCLRAGGLPTDSQWYPYSSYWISTGGSGNGIRQYVTNNNLFFHSTNQYKACAGSIINWLNSSGGNAGHVGLVDQNDTHTMTFCAHTKCRKSCPWTGEKVDFYVPYWDSVNGTWINP